MEIDPKVASEIKERVGVARYAHILRVVSMAEKLAQVHQIDRKKAQIAAYYHDCAKTKTRQELYALCHEIGFVPDPSLEDHPQVIHAHLGSRLAEVRYGIKDRDILNAIAYHTTGRAGMTRLECLIYLADYVEEGRNFPQVEKYRQAAFRNLDEAMHLVVKNTLYFLLEKDRKIALDTIECWNERN